MSANEMIFQQSGLTAADRAASQVGGSQATMCPVAGPDGRSRLRLQFIEPVALVRFSASDFLVGESVTQEVIDQLKQLVEAKGYARLLLNFTGVRYLSSEMLAALVGLGKEVDQRGGRVQLCGLDPLMRDLFRTTHLDHVFDITADEAEALGILIH